MDTTLTRNVIQSEYFSRFGRNSYTWQMDVAEALILGLDSVGPVGGREDDALCYAIVVLISRSVALGKLSEF